MFYNKCKLRKRGITWNGGIFRCFSAQRKVILRKTVRYNIQHNNILFEFPEGFTQLRLIEECRALNCLDVSDPDNFDMIYDITMQMLEGKAVFIYFVDEKSKTRNWKVCCYRQIYESTRSRDY